MAAGAALLATAAAPEDGMEWIVVGLALAGKFLMTGEYGICVIPVCVKTKVRFSSLHYNMYAVRTSSTSFSTVFIFFLAQTME